MSLSQIPFLCDILFKADIINGQRRVVFWWSALWWDLEEMWRLVDQDPLSEYSFTQWTERTEAPWKTAASFILHSPCLCTLLLCVHHPFSMSTYLHSQVPSMASWKKGRIYLECCQARRRMRRCAAEFEWDKPSFKIIGHGCLVVFSLLSTRATFRNRQH